MAPPYIQLYSIQKHRNHSLFLFFPLPQKSFFNPQFPLPQIYSPPCPSCSISKSHWLSFQTTYVICPQSVILLPPQSKPPSSLAGLLLLLLSVLPASTQTPRPIRLCFTVEFPQVSRVIFWKHTLGHVNFLL